MSNFSIEIDPLLPDLGEVETISISGLDYGLIYKAFPEEYDVIYDVWGQKFQYYPTSIVTVLNDLYYEWELSHTRTPHFMTLCGYTVLEIDFEGELAVFLDPLQSLRHGIRKPIGDPLPAALVEKTFKSAVGRVLKFIRCVD